jgi:uncharacterized protein YndB with AHSA1/START domain
MTDTLMLDAYGTLVEPATLRIQRLLPGPIDRVWSYLTQSELRRQWLAAGVMTLEKDAPFTFTWRNDELTDPPGRRPDGMGAEHSMTGHIIELDAPRKLTFAWADTGGEVSFELEPQGGEVLLTVTHRRIPNRDFLLRVSGGWHMHLDLLADRLAGRAPATPFWDGWARLKDEYERRLP